MSSMGDHRASIKISMEFHGVKDSIEMWINYCPYGEYEGIDDRIIEFIRSVYNRGMEKYDKHVQEYFRGEEEKKEREEYERLKNKYDK